MNQSELIDAYERLFAERGWKELVEDLNEKREALKNILADTNTTYDQVQYIRGRLDCMRYITTLESTVDAIKQQASLPNVE